MQIHFIPSILLKKPVIILLLNCLIFTGCRKSWLDEKTSQSLAVPATLKDYQYLLNDSYKLNLQNGDLHEVASDGHYFDAGFFSGPDILLNAYTWKRHMPFMGLRDWLKPYQAISICNIVLEGLESIQPQNEAERNSYNNIKGEALFFRSYYFYELAQLFAPPYVANTASSDLGIPLRLNTNVNEVSVRSTVERTYTQIIGDVINAETLLPFELKFPVDHRSYPSGTSF